MTTVYMIINGSARQVYVSCYMSQQQDGSAHIIGAAIRQWRTRLRTCIKAKGGHFEHTLSQ